MPTHASPLAAVETSAATTAQPFDADSTLRYLESPARRRLNKVVAVLGVLVYAVYLVYRTLYTINPEALVFSLVVYAAEVHGFFALCFYFFQTWDLRGRVVPAPANDLTVDVFVTTYNEDVAILRQTLRSAMAMTYPHTTYVLDDGRRDEVKALADELGCRYITRANNEHAKAGNWNNAFRQTTGQVIATFDADHAPRADFLVRTLGFFRDPKVALVQVPQRYHNLDSPQHRVDWKNRRMYGEQDVFFNLISPGKDHWNAAFFCGTGAVLRREALEPRGGLETGSITEDMHTALALHADGWKSVYLDELLVTGLAPMDFASLQVQRLRWAEGNLKIIRSINPITEPGLTLAQRICYSGSMYHWTTGVAKLVFYFAPPWILFTGQYPIANFRPTFVLIYGALLLSLAVSYKVLSRGHGRLLMDELFNMATAFTLARAVKRLLVGRRRPSIFVVTGKGTSTTRDLTVALPFLGLVAFSLLGIEWCLLMLRFDVADDVFGLGLAMFWTVWNLWMMLAVIEIALRPPQRREACRFVTACPVTMKAPSPGGAPATGMTANLSPTGCELLWLGPLPVGSRWSLSVALGPQTFECKGEITTTYHRRRGPWFVHGVRFVGLTNEQTDVLNDALLNMVVPRLFGDLSEPSQTVHLWRRIVKRVTDRYIPRPRRSFINVPVQVTTGPATVLALLHDVSTNGFGIVMPRAMSTGTRMKVTVLGAKPWSVNVTVARSQPLPASLPAFQTWLVGLQVEAQIDASEVHRRMSEEVAA